MSASIKYLIAGLDIIYSEPRAFPSLPCPCGSGVIEDDCTCQDAPVRCESCWHSQDHCECEDSDEVSYADSVGYSEGKHS